MWAQEGKGDVKPVLLRFVEVEERKVVRSWERQQGGAAERGSEASSVQSCPNLR